MAKKKKAPFTFESNLDAITEKIKEKPRRVLAIIGNAIVREVRPTLPQYFTKRTGELSKSFGSFFKKKDGSLEIGFKKFYAPMVMGKEKDPILPVVLKNKDNIVKMIADALDQISKE